MANAPADRWLCPTRADGTASLIAHSITRPLCQDRQRLHYHKCATCEHRNGYATNGRVTSPTPSGGEAPVAEPPQVARLPVEARTSGRPGVVVAPVCN